MAKTKWWVVALVTVLVVFALAAGGYALYRLGYGRGMQANLLERGTPQRFLDQPDREGKPFVIIPRHKAFEFGHRFMFLDRDLRRPALFPWRVIIPMAVVGILIALVAVLAAVLLTRRNRPQMTAPAPPEKAQSLDEPKAKE